jgi:hypothetical protein
MQSFELIATIAQVCWHGQPVKEAYLIVFNHFFVEKPHFKQLDSFTQAMLISLFNAIDCIFCMNIK